MKSIERYYDEKTASEYESTRSDELWKRENSVFEAIISRITSGELNDSISSINRLKVLDLPAGTGRWIPFLQNRNIDYVGVDISEEMLEHAQGKLEGLTSDNNTYQFVQSPYQKYLPTVHDEFDLVICTRFLPHFSLKEVEKIVGLMAAKTRKYLNDK